MLSVLGSLHLQSAMFRVSVYLHRNGLVLACGTGPSVTGTGVSFFFFFSFFFGVCVPRISNENAPALLAVYMRGWIGRKLIFLQRDSTVQTRDCNKDHTCEPVWPSGKALASKQGDLGSNPLRLSFFFKSCGLWTLPNCDFVPHN